ncbi:hypothetical protein [Blastococcus sp. TF02A-30]|uniref:hypothetical protein n=1 Tax=Blastococcus sp. TF02A-30 TaxID=2250580 RepID=UPI000DE8BB79|nr:hypothetical protein [Blastococcus sp. TF02A-30]RBY87718.1 hypothetical protein DQ241_10585 [Blastococcus sp. TF02A-30]
MELGRLLALARLTPAQALELGAGVLAAAVPAGAEDDGGGRAAPGARVWVAADGRVVLRGPAEGGTRPLDAVLAGIAAAVGRPGAGADPTAARHLEELDGAVRDLPTTGPAVVARRLQEAAACLDRTAVRAELAALARAVGERATGPGGVAGRTGAPVAARPAPPAPRAPVPLRRRIGAWLLSVLVLVAAVVSEVVFLRDQIAADVDTLLDAGRGADEPTASAPATPSVPAPAPPSAGSVLGVDLRPLGRCAPGAPCTVRVLVRLAPAAEARVVTWSYVVVDGCSGPTVSVPGGTLTAPPEADRIEAVGVVPVPAGDGVAVVAVTGAPASAASAPVVLGSCPAAGPGS